MGGGESKVRARPCERGGSDEGGGSCAADASPPLADTPSAACRGCGLERRGVAPDRRRRRSSTRRVQSPAPGVARRGVCRTCGVG